MFSKRPLTSHPSLFTTSRRYILLNDAKWSRRKSSSLTRSIPCGTTISIRLSTRILYRSASVPTFMSENPLDLIASIAVIAAEPRGLRSDCQRIIEAIDKDLGTLLLFVYLKNSETDAIEVIAASGLDAI